tara:strand:+ start:112 stop:327 length:216 start_codon:yes stop_codon:yes gene_type:complete
MINNILTSVFYTLIMTVIMFVILGTMLDALEYETTQSCNSCKFLPHLDKRFQAKDLADSELDATVLSPSFD